MPGGSRKSHPKSRNGCGQCKRRRIKCDGRPPGCMRCEKSGLECDYYAALGISPASASLFSPDLEVVARTADQILSPAAFISVVPSMISALPPGIGYSELDLLHHYAVSTAQTLGARPVAQNGKIWTCTVPQAAQTYGFLRYHVLAISALHIAFLNPDSQASYYEIGVSYHNTALQLYRPSTGAVTDSNVLAIIASGLLLFIVQQAMPIASREDPNPSLETLLHPIIVFRQSSAFFYTACFDAAMRSPFSFEYPIDKKPEITDPIALRAIGTLKRLNEMSNDPEEHKLLFDSAIMRLGMSFAITGLRPANWSRMMFWARTQPAEFFPLALQRWPMALVLIAYWCVPMHNAPPVWFIGDWPANVISVVSGILGEAWRPAMQWPLMEIGTVEPPVGMYGADFGYISALSAPSSHY